MTHRICASTRRIRLTSRSGVPARVLLTMRPEWMPAFDDTVGFPRAFNAIEKRVEIPFAVPVIIDGEVRWS